MEPVADSGTSKQRDTAELYRQFGETEAASSPLYREWSLGVADDEQVIALIDELAGNKRQVNLVFAAARYLDVPLTRYAQFREWLIENWAAVKTVALTHATQTNEAARCAMLLPLLAGIRGPLALLEVGASAGLCLFPDRYSYCYDERDRIDPTDGPSGVLLKARTTGPVPFPQRMPEVVWRAGIDLNPLSVASADDTAWLEALIWPEHDDRRARLRAAIEIARVDPPRIAAGDLNEALPELAASAPVDATLVVFHTAVLAYLSADDRTRFVASASALPGHWISNEGRSVTPGVAERLGEVQPEPGEFVLAVDGTPVAFAQPHGRYLRWL